MVRYGDVGEGPDGLRVLRHDGRGHARAPVVADPDGGIAAGVRQQGHHAFHNGLLAVVVDDAASGRLSPPRHVRGDGAEADPGEGVELGFPGDRRAGPAVDKEDQGAIDGTGRDVVDFLLAAGVDDLMVRKDVSVGHGVGEGVDEGLACYSSNRTWMVRRIHLLH